MARTKTNKKQKIQDFKPKLTADKAKGVQFSNNSGALYPPKKSIAVIQLNKTIDEYSPRKKKMKGTEECSVIKPETSSDSASCKSKGVRLVSANTEIK